MNGKHTMMESLKIKQCAEAFICEGGKVLIARRAEDEDALPGYWEVVGGGVEPGETAEEAAVREAHEESGLRVVCGEHFYNFPFNLADGTPMVAQAFMCSANGVTDVVLNEEHDEYRWIGEDELDSVEPMTDRMRGLVKAGFEYVKRRS